MIFGELFEDFCRNWFVVRNQRMKERTFASTRVVAFVVQLLRVCKIILFKLGSSHQVFKSHQQGLAICKSTESRQANTEFCKIKFGLPQHGKQFFDRAN